MNKRLSRRNRNGFNRKLLISLLSVGVFGATIVGVCSYHTDAKTVKRITKINNEIALNTSNKISKQAPTEAFLRSKDIQFDMPVDSISVTDLYKQSKAVRESDLIRRGEIKVADIGLRTSIYEGTNLKQLSNGVGTASDSEKLGEGLYAVAGYNFVGTKKSEQFLLSPLQKEVAPYEFINNKESLKPYLNIKKGMEIKAADNEMVYTYKVSNTFVTNSANVTDIQHELEGLVEAGDTKPLITLITSLNVQGDYETDKSIVVVGELDSKKDLTDERELLFFKTKELS
ncbi:sortase domain-containing protein [Kurthia sibirica]|uniref:Uncharacterized protein n=1 Tax=Kurthia sibirica TaxID=202750 RepID=A0A2U3AFP1_9BACL|nr:sortase [Kurthia sibirica]PWI23372.1 hypothetical protein DEX24_16200 [Kurthia sibirica]GEK35520.1 hypothetical protein KSI01_30530 [Kurthia sibirica]